MSFLSSAKGQGLAEYALILALVGIVAMVVLLALGGPIRTVFSAVVEGLGS